MILVGLSHYGSRWDLPCAVAVIRQPYNNLSNNKTLYLAIAFEVVHLYNI